MINIFYSNFFTCFSWSKVTPYMFILCSYVCSYINNNDNFDGTPNVLYIYIFIKIQLLQSPSHEICSLDVPQLPL